MTHAETGVPGAGRPPISGAAEILVEVRRLVEQSGALGRAAGHLPGPLRRAPEAFRFMARAGNVGKIVLTLPASARPGGTQCC